MAWYFGLIGGELLAGDSTKLRAQNSKKNNDNQSKIARHPAYIEGKLQEGQQALAQARDPFQAEKRFDSMARHARRREYYLQLLHYLQDSARTRSPFHIPRACN